MKILKELVWLGDLDLYFCASLTVEYEPGSFVQEFTYEVKIETKLLTLNHDLKLTFVS